jgi:predicted nucleic acid-binding Zn ribbon protein
MKTPAPKRIGDLIPALLERLGLSKGLHDYEVLERWPEIVGPKIAEVATAERIRDGKLWVSVSHPAWRNELTFMKQELIGKINRAMGNEIVRDIIFR